MKRSRRVLELALAGAGLVLSGAALWNLLAHADGSNSGQGIDFTAVPAPVAFNAPSLTLRDVDGIEHSLSDYRGRVVLVNLWATWCPPCIAEMPNLQRFYERYRDQGFIVIAIDDGDPLEEVRSFVAKHSLTFPIWLDNTYDATDRAFKTSSLPSSYVIDRIGQVRLVWFGAISERMLEEYVPPIIEEY